MAGFKVYNDAGTIQFSADIKNICVTQKGVISSWSSYSSLYTGLRVWTVTYTPNFAMHPLIAFRTSGGSVAPLGKSFGSGVWTFTFLTDNSVSAIEYWIFDELPNVPVSVGLNLWDASGALVYASNAHPLRIVPPLINTDAPFDWWDTGGGGPAAGGVSESFALPAGRTYAAIVAKPTHVLTYNYLGAGNYTYSSAILTVSSVSNAIVTNMLWTTRESATTTSPDNSLERRTMSRSIIPVDVTNY